MEFVIQQNDGKYTVNSSAISYLKNVGDSSIAIIGVAGLMRKGKSTLLNMMLGSRIFATSSGSNSKTRGLWMAELSPGIVLMDCEGLGATHTDEKQQTKHDFNIFSLCVLLSSIMIYNNDGPITNDSLQSLKVAAQLANMIKNIAKVKLSDTMLVWLSRNMVLKTQDLQNQPCDGDTYLEVNIANRTGITDLFPQRSFFSLPPPGDMTNANTKLAPAFVSGIKTLKEKLLHKLEPKKCNGVELTGNTLLLLVNSIVESINSGKMIDLMPVWEASVQIRETTAKTKTLDFIKQDSCDNGITTLKQAMTIYHEHSVEPQPNVFYEFASLCILIEEQNFQKWVNGDMKLTNIPKSVTRYIEPFIQNEISVLNVKVDDLTKINNELSDELKLSKTKHEKQFNNMKQTYQEKLDQLEGCDENTKQEISVLKTKLSDFQVANAGLEANCNDISLELSDARESLTETTTSNLKLRLKLKEKEEALANAVQDAEHLRSTVHQRINDIQQNMTKYKLVNETTLRNLSQCETQVSKLRTEKAELEEQHTKDLQEVTTIIEKLKKERVEISKELESTKNVLLQTETQLKIVKSREETTSKKRQRPAEVTEAEIEWLRSQHETDLKDMKRLRDDYNASLRKALELEVNSLRMS